MEKVIFYKYEGAGNDFIMLDNREGLYSELTEKQIINLCNRHFGIGSDGLILINFSISSDFEMKFYNPDCSQSFCGNGARCAVAFYSWLVDRKGVFSFEAYDGVHTAEYLIENQVKIKMSDVNQIQDLGESNYELNTGSPHLVKFVQNVDSLNVLKEGAEIRYSDNYLTQGINVNFVQKLNDNNLVIRTYERGVENETLACGTGITAAVLSYAKSVNLSGKHKIQVHARGGELAVEFYKTNQIYTDICLEGPAQFVFKGEIYV